MQTIKITDNKSAYIETTKILAVESYKHELNLKLYMSGVDKPLINLQFDDQQLFEEADLLLQGSTNGQQEITS